jgi:molecular chaperone Hsp33
MANAPRDDCITRFEVARLGLMGRLVRLGPAAQDVLAPHQYPEPVAALLGELVAVTAALVATLKFEGKFILQTKGDGAVPLMVANAGTLKVCAVPGIL